MNTSHVRYLREITTKDIESGDFNLNEIISKQIDGIILKDFLSTQELELILAGFQSTTSDERVQINTGFDSHPITFAQFSQMTQANLLSESEYFSISEKFTSTFATRYGVDILQKLKHMIAISGNGIKLSIPFPENQTINYVPFTFRELYPERGNLKAHCENLFYKEFPGYFERINAFSIKDHQLSFFVTLQCPEEGGEITLYDLIWNDIQTRNTDVHVDLGDGRIISLESDDIKHEKFKPSAGSLVVFSGGDIWHRVETVKGSISRITLGGFMSFSPDKKTLFCWS